MLRAWPVEYPGAICHVMNCGDYREPIFHDAADVERVLQTSIIACGKVAWRIQLKVLMFSLPCRNG